MTRPTMLYVCQTCISPRRSRCPHGAFGHLLAVSEWLTQHPIVLNYPPHIWLHADCPQEPAPPPPNEEGSAPLPISAAQVAARAKVQYSNKVAIVHLQSGELDRGLVVVSRHRLRVLSPRTTCGTQANDGHTHTHPSPLAPHPSPLAPHHSPLIPHPLPHPQRPPPVRSHPHTLDTRTAQANGGGYPSDFASGGADGAAASRLLQPELLLLPPR